MRKTQITDEVINTFINGYDPEEHITNLDYNYSDDFVTVISRNKEDKREKKKHPFYPFLWATKEACFRLCGGNRDEVKKLLKQYGIKCLGLDYKNNEGKEVESVKNGYAFMFKATVPMSYQKFLQFFKVARNPVYRDNNLKDGEYLPDKSKDRQYLMATPQEQFLISTGKRFFKGYDDYNQLLRLIFDLETEGLDPQRHRIISIGVRFNRPVTYKGVTKQYEKIIELDGETEEEKNHSELRIICFLLNCIKTFEPDVIGGHNTENFDWNFLMVRCGKLGVDWQKLTEKYLGEGNSIYKKKKESVLKLGGEVEHFFQTVVPFTTVVDSLHAVRRAQATDSNFKEANLKYATRYLKLVKPNRVYVPGNKISEISADYEEHYAFNDANGHWYIYDPNSPTPQNDIKVEVGKDFKLTRRPTIEEGYKLVSGHYIVERYLLDDIYEGDVVELAMNQADFMLCKLIPTVFQKAITMGTAGQWKLIMMAWSYENGLAIPKPSDSGKFTGGLSRLLLTGAILPTKNKESEDYNDQKVLKLDFNSLYPSIILTWHISDETDLMEAMLKMLEYVLTTRELHKKLKKNAEIIKDEFEERISRGDTLSDEEQEKYNESCKTFKIEENLQLVVKRLGNSFFGSYGSNNGSVFPWKSVICAERTTCTGRQSLRLMISHFSTISTFRSWEKDGVIYTDHNGEDLGPDYNYTPVVGDSFTEDTPLFIKYENGNIDIKPICELINEDHIQIDALGREYDYSKKPYKVLCCSGWVEPSYIYRHKTDKDIYEVSDGDMKVEVTEDHSLFNDKQEKIKPSEIKGNTKLEYFTDDNAFNEPKQLIIDASHPEYYAKELADGKIDRVPIQFLNNPKEGQEFYRYFMEYQRDDVNYSKTCLAGLLFLRDLTK